MMFAAISLGTTIQSNPWIVWLTFGILTLIIIILIFGVIYSTYHLLKEPSNNKKVKSKKVKINKESKVKSSKNNKLVTKNNSNKNIDITSNDERIDSTLALTNEIKKERSNSQEPTPIIKSDVDKDPLPNHINNDIELTAENNETLKRISSDNRNPMNRPERNTDEFYSQKETLTQEIYNQNLQDKEVSINTQINTSPINDEKMFKELQKDINSHTVEINNKELLKGIYKEDEELFSTINEIKNQKDQEIKNNSREELLNNAKRNDYQTELLNNAQLNDFKIENLTSQVKVAFDEIRRNNEEIKSVISGLMQSKNPVQKNEDISEAISRIDFLKGMTQELSAIKNETSNTPSRDPELVNQLKLMKGEISRLNSEIYNNSNIIKNIQSSKLDDKNSGNILSDRDDLLSKIDQLKSKAELLSDLTKEK